MKRSLYVAAMGLSVFMAAAALASQGYVTRDVSLRAGPDSSYPRVSMLGAGTVVVIEGCTNDWSWCDVASEDSRGWMAGAFLQYEYQGRRVLVPAYGMQIGIPIVTFELDRYWGSYYRDRPWYGERWSHDRHQYQPAANRYGSYGNDRAHDNDQGTSYRNAHAVPPADARPSYGAHSREGDAVRPADSGAIREGSSNRMAQQRPVETDHRPPAGNAGHARQDEYKAHETSAPRKDEQGRSKVKQDEGKDDGQH